MQNNGVTPMMLYDKLYAQYGNLHWWPAQTPYEVMVGAVLTQNTAWTNVEKALANFGTQLSAELVENMPVQELCERIRPAGFFNQKALYLKALTAWFKTYDYSAACAAKTDLSILRRELLCVKGVGAETADSVLLYALNLPSFVVDAYTKRLLKRIGVCPNAGQAQLYDAIQQYFEQAIPKDVALYNNYHALIVENAKEHCRAKPLCTACPLADICAHASAAL